MKLISSAFVTLICLIFPVVISQYPNQILDSGGGPLMEGLRYYIMPYYARSGGGGVTLSNTTNSTCPVTVVQDPSTDNDGFRVKFTAQGFNIGYISEGLALDISFENDKPDCASTKKWIAVVDENSTWIGIGGSQDHADKKVINGSITIKKCDGVCNQIQYCLNRLNKTDFPSNCFNITRVDDGRNGRRLVLSKHDSPYRVRFDMATLE